MANFSFERTTTFSPDNPSAMGEALREEFFDQDIENGVVGCYSTFDLRNDVRELPPLPVDDGEYEWDVSWTRADKDINGSNVTMQYYWDGDGILQFILPGGGILENTDCKKLGRWEYYEKE